MQAYYWLRRGALVVEHQVVIFDVPFSNVGFDEACDIIRKRIGSREPGFIVTPNVHHVCIHARCPALREAYHEAFLSLVDGTPLVWAAHLTGKPLREKLSGSDMVMGLSEVAAREGWSIFFLGAEAGVGAEAARRLTLQYPGLRVAGWHSPPMGFHADAEENRRTLDIVREASPDICFVALGAPVQELWMHRNYRESGAVVMAGIGAGIDFAAGRKKRAPAWMQHSGTEWLWRLLHEPRRLWRRYLVEDARFAPIMLNELFKRLKPKR